MNNDEVKNKIYIAFQKAISELPIENIDFQAKLIDTYDIDSLKFIDFIVEIENLFSIEIKDNDLDINNYDTLQSVVDMLVNEYL